MYSAPSAQSLRRWPAARVQVEAGLQAIEGKCPGVFVKNLVVRDKKAGLFLLSVRHDAKVDMKALPQLLGVSGGNFRMADSALMTEKLGVAQAVALANPHPRLPSRPPPPTAAALSRLPPRPPPSPTRIDPSARRVSRCDARCLFAPRAPSHRSP